MDDLHSPSSPEIKSQSYATVLRLARQAAQNGARSRAAQFYKLAGAAAAAIYDNEAALDCYNRALALTQQSAMAERFWLLLARERLHALSGAAKEQAEDLTSLEMIADILNEDMFRAQVAARQAAWREATGDLAGAVTVASMATRLAQLTDLPLAEAMARLAWGRALIRQSHYRQAQDQLDRALTLARQVDDKALSATIERFRGVLAYDRAQMAPAQTAYQRALTLYKEVGDRQGQLHIHSNLGQILQARGRLAQARAHWEESLKLFRELGDAEGSLRTLINLAAASCDVGLYAAARNYAQQALHEARQSSMIIGECFAHLNLGLAAHYQGENEISAAENISALALAQQLGSQRLQAHAQAVLGHALVELEQFSAAEEAYWEAVAIWEQLEIPNMVAEAKAGLARLALRQQKMDLAGQLVATIWEQAQLDPDFEGAELPVRIYLTCRHVWSETNDVRADEAYRRGLRLLEQQTAGLNDESDRHSLRQNIPAHRDILAL